MLGKKMKSNPNKVVPPYLLPIGHRPFESGQPLISLSSGHLWRCTFLPVASSSRGPPTFDHWPPQTSDHPSTHLSLASINRCPLPLISYHHRPSSNLDDQPHLKTNSSSKCYSLSIPTVVVVLW